MIPLSVDSAGIHVFAFTLHWYGILVVVSTWIAVEVATWLAARDGRDPEHIWRGLVWVALGGLIGARLWFVLFPPDSMVAIGRTPDWFLSHIFDLNQGVIAVWTGGLGLIGGLAGGALGMAIYTRRRGLLLLPWLDIAAVALPLAQAIGRWGNAASQDLYGPPTTLPWGVLIDAAEQRVGPYTDLVRYPLATTRFHPVYLYESLWMTLVFVLLLTLFRRYRSRFAPGWFALLYVALYSSGRFMLEFLRVNVSHAGTVNVSQAVAAVEAVLAVGALLLYSRTNVLRPPSQNIHSSTTESTLQS